MYFLMYFFVCIYSRNNTSFVFMSNREIIEWMYNNAFDFSDTIMALKRRRFGQLNELDKKTKVTRDIEHLRKLRGHSNIITLYGYFEMCGEAFICMEKMETCFAKILQICVKKDILIPTKVLATLCYSISSALVFLKEKKIIHRDVKPG